MNTTATTITAAAAAANTPAARNLKAFFDHCQREELLNMAIKAAYAAGRAGLGLTAREQQEMRDEIEMAFCGGMRDAKLAAGLPGRAD
jgi:hypothetical protein